jgi:hypothetical protein
MKEIRFACPKCNQHIACDGEYAHFGIECPGCGQPLVVPRIGARDGSIPPPILRTQANVTDQHANQAAYNSIRKTPFWAIGFIATILLGARMMKSSQLSVSLVAYFVLSALVTIILLIVALVRNGDRSPLAVFGLVVVSMLSLVALGLGLLFLGCSALLKQ